MTTEYEVYEEARRLTETIDEFLVVKMTNPKFGKDGNQFYYMLGEDLQSGISGFGDSPYDAMRDFNKSFYGYK